MKVDVEDLLLRADAAIEAGNHEEARSIFESVMKFPNVPIWGLSIQLKLTQASGLDASTHQIVSKIENDPAAQSLSNIITSAEYLAKVGLSRRAARLYQMVLDWNVSFPGVYRRFSECRFTGGHYLFALDEVHRTIRPEVYLEIGVNRGHSFRGSVGSDLAVGVDPDLSELDRAAFQKARLFEISSDAFFEKEASGVFGERRVNFAFIDGMHRFDFALRDFINTERHMAPDGLIAIHDVIPIHRSGAGENSNAKHWTGDVWKLADTLKHFRPDLRLRIVPVAPTGLLLVSGLDPSGGRFSQIGSEVRRFAEALEFGEGAVWKMTPDIPEIAISEVLAEIR